MKKALYNTTEPVGIDDRGYRIVDVVDVGNTFETHPNLVWVDCNDNVLADHNWYDPTTSTIRKMPAAVDPVATAGELATDADGNITEDYQWNWETETWSKVQLI